jgi:hypothetical protein
MRTDNRRGFRTPVREIGLAQILPNVFRRIQFRASGRQWNQDEVVREPELAGGGPSALSRIISAWAPGASSICYCTASVSAWAA